MLAPSGLFAKTKGKKDQAAKDENGDDRVLSHFGRRYLVIKTRKRVTADGGASVLVVDSQEEANDDSDGDSDSSS